MLGDVSAERSKANINTRLRFDQSKEVHNEYIMHLYDLFKDFVGTSPKVTNRKADKRTGKIYNSVNFKTLAFPIFNYNRAVFYPENIKRVPKNISDLLTPVGLAYWIMDDGGRGTSGGLLLHTNSYKLEEVKLLIKVLKEKFKVECWQRSPRRENQWAILIPKRE